MERLKFVFFGILTFLFEAALIYGLMLCIRRAGPVDTQAELRIYVSLFTATISTIGLLFARRWAAIALSCATAAFAVWLMW